jgi:hypothetical protein
MGSLTLLFNGSEIDSYPQDTRLQWGARVYDPAEDTYKAYVERWERAEVAIGLKVRRVDPVSKLLTDGVERHTLSPNQLHVFNTVLETEL